ncbi:HI0074 family nucleotidyltransferase substrate-binding subunit [uncultured Selenomonas sp.]|jgi:nucleotidyltransferase substrate-binding family protein|uniref:HI0074 family nucleotidyltransferase substrate-binding subunit n=1 Tax=uncultured Selenomonas sp. TaxID=159275 RepID=UPI0028DCAC88|nr:HI0074 family nucleotidyltransferase substrate-binding subunit [uncultured Selenomonas sp.]
MKRYDEFVRHLAVLRQAHTQDLSNEFIVSGVIDKFFIQFELGWKLLKDLLRYEGLEVSVSGSPRTIIKEAYLLYDFLDEETWLGMLHARNDVTHIYNSTLAQNLVGDILTQYIPAFTAMEAGLRARYGDLLIG